MKYLIILVFVVLNFCLSDSGQAQSSKDALFLFSSYWHENVNETNFSFNLEEDSSIDEKDLLRLIEDCCSRTIRVDLPGEVMLEMVRIPGGSYLMGRYPGEQDSSAIEDPQHQVNIGYDFYMGKYEVTKAQWEAVMGTTPWSGGSYVINDPGSPAVYVDWNDAQAFITALNQLGQGTFRLPSEAEWEYACRAGTTTCFYWGDDPGYSQIDDYAWWSGNGWDANERYAHVVGQKLPNAFGLYDMSGNVFEWCQDYWHDSYTGAPTDGSAWESPASSYRVIRGGTWRLNARYCRSANRNRNLPEFSYDYYGFRVVRTQ